VPNGEDVGPPAQRRLEEAACGVHGQRIEIGKVTGVTRPTGSGNTRFFTARARHGFSEASLRVIESTPAKDTRPITTHEEPEHHLAVVRVVAVAHARPATELWERIANHEEREENRVQYADGGDGTKHDHLHAPA